MRKLAVFLFCILLMGITSGCGSNYDWSIDSEEGLKAVKKTEDTINWSCLTVGIHPGSLYMNLRIRGTFI